MERSKIELDRCILFPRAEGAVTAIENGDLDSRYEIEVLDLTYSALSKLQIFGFFDYPDELEASVNKNDFVKISATNLPIVIETALKSRKRTNDRELLKIIDTFIEKAKLSVNSELPIWFNI